MGQEGFVVPVNKKLSTHKADDDVDEEILWDALIAAVDEVRLVVQRVVAVTLHRHSRDLCRTRNSRHLKQTERIMGLIYTYKM